MADRRSPGFRQMLFRPAGLLLRLPAWLAVQVAERPQWRGVAIVAALALFGALGYLLGVECLRSAGNGFSPPAYQWGQGDAAPESEAGEVPYWFPSWRDPFRSFNAVRRPGGAPAAGPDYLSGGAPSWFVVRNGQREPVGFSTEYTSPYEKQWPAASPEEVAASMKIPVSFPDLTTVLKEHAGISDRRLLAYDVYVPRECRGWIGCAFVLKDKDGLWFEARSRKRLFPGSWNTVVADLSGDSPDLQPVDHHAAWSEYRAGNVAAIGFTFHGDTPYTGCVYLDNLRTWRDRQSFLAWYQREVKGKAFGELAPEMRLVAARAGKAQFQAKKAELEQQYQAAAREKPPPLVMLHFRESGAVARYGCFEVAFELSCQVDNPFDPDQVDVAAEFLPPGETSATKAITVPGFYYQDFRREERFGKDHYFPVGRPHYRVRFTPAQTGRYRYRVRVTLDRNDARSADGAQRPEQFACTQWRSFAVSESDHPGFVRVSKKDPIYFETERGGFWFPVGHNVRSPTDNRCAQVLTLPTPPDRGTFFYDEIFRKMGQNGENLAEVWLAPWFLALEWTALWRGYHGVGRYHLEHAWKLDYLFELARRHGLRLHLVLDNHGKFSEWCDPEWVHCPYNGWSAGGAPPLLSADDFFSKSAARTQYRHLLRYIVARWAHDPALAGLELVSEFNLCGSRREWSRTEVARSWVQEMLNFVKRLDVYGHPLTVHYSSDANHIDFDLILRPQSGFDYVTGDAYRSRGDDRPPHADAGELLRGGNYTRMAHWTQRVIETRLWHQKKLPYLITEYGGDWSGATPQQLRADLHAGLWSSFMVGTAGTPLFWWFDLVDRENLYFHYRAFANYIRGEDKRGKQLHYRSFRCSGPGAEALRGIVALGRTLAYGWVYDFQHLDSLPPREKQRTYAHITAPIGHLQPGEYRLEVWDTWSGEPVEIKELKTTDGALQLPLPRFRCDVAFKVKPSR